MGVIEGISGLRAAAELTRILREGLKSGSIKADEIAGRIGEIYDFIIDSKAALIDAKDEINTLKLEIEKLSDDKAFRASLIFNVSGYYARRARDGSEERYCSVCLDDANKRIRLVGDANYCHKHGTCDL